VRALLLDDHVLEVDAGVDVGEVLVLVHGVDAREAQRQLRRVQHRLDHAHVAVDLRARAPPLAARHRRLHTAAQAVPGPKQVELSALGGSSTLLLLSLLGCEGRAGCGLGMQRAPATGRQGGCSVARRPWQSGSALQQSAARQIAAQPCGWNVLYGAGGQM